MPVFVRFQAEQDRPDAVDAEEGTMLAMNSADAGISSAVKFALPALSAASTSAYETLIPCA